MERSKSWHCSNQLGLLIWGVSDTNKTVTDRQSLGGGGSQKTALPRTVLAVWEPSEGCNSAFVLALYFQTRQELGSMPSSVPILNFQSFRCQEMNLNVERYPNREPSQGTVSSINVLPLLINDLYLGLLFSSSGLGSENTIYTFQDFLS